MLSAAVFVGNGLGSILLGSLSDRLGRKERHS
jgi:MFS family permease